MKKEHTVDIMEDFHREVLAGTAKVVPPSGMSMWLMMGNHIDDWIKLATLLYIVVQITVLLTTKWLQWTGRMGKLGHGHTEEAVGGAPRPDRIEPS